MAALSTGCTVQGFKVGPDYIDPMYHTAATGRASRNLDSWMLPHAQVKATFARAVVGADLAIIEGVMGLFDGYDARTESGSTAEVAKLLRAPVILVLDVRRMARSAGAMALGYRDFDPDLDVAGVICNRVGSERHARWVTGAVEDLGLSVLGCIPRSEGLKIPGRHLGLYTAVERSAEVRVFLEHARELMTRNVDLDKLLTIARRAPALEVEEKAILPRAPAPRRHRVRLAVARDEAFCFYYKDNLDLLRAAGAEVVFFSPLRDTALPEGTAGLYFGGGYPELYAEELARNEALRGVIREAHEAGVPIYAECGGLMFLTRSIVDLEGKRHPGVGLLPGHSRMRQRLRMGYRLVTACRDSLLLRRGEQIRGHEFHYSDWVDQPPDLRYAYEIVPRRGEEARREGYAQGNLLASYVHLHFGARLDLAIRFVNACMRRRENDSRKL
jgi:cobyrinic acid a,c-diamide synthase